MFKDLNKYDGLIIIIITSLAGGELGGAMSMVRILSFLVFPFVLANIGKVSIYPLFKKVKVFLLFLLLWGAFSLFWTNDGPEGMKAILYNLVHANLFIALLLFSTKSINPIRSICIGWLCVALFTLPIALNELISDKHLHFSAFGNDYKKNAGAEGIIQWKYAAVTFYNYNAYNVILCLTLPFILHLYSIFKSKYAHILLWCVTLILLWVVIQNASRGAILSCLIIGGIYICIYRSYIIKHKFVLICALAGCVFVVYRYFDTLFYQILIRLASKDSFFEDSARDNLIVLILQIVIQTGFLGNGIGSVANSLKEHNSQLLATHNFFLEMLLQYGLVITGIVLMFFYKSFLIGWRSLQKENKALLVACTVAFPLIGVINSMYMLDPSIWMFFASLVIVVAYTVSYRKKNKLKQVG